MEEYKKYRENGYRGRQSQRAKNNIFNQPRRERNTGDFFVTLAAFILFVGSGMIMIKSFFPTYDKDFSYYESSGVAWNILRTISILLIVLIPYLVTYQKWAFYAVILLEISGIVILLLAAKGGFLIGAAEWVLVLLLLAPIFLLFVRQKEYTYPIYYRFSIGSVMGAIVFLLLQWSNTAFSLFIVYKQISRPVSIGKCYLRSLAILFPGGQFVTDSGWSNVPMLHGSFTVFLSGVLWLSIVATLLLTVYAWLVCKPGESELLEFVGYFMMMAVTQVSVPCEGAVK